jgi:hypothetical protein
MAVGRLAASCTTVVSRFETARQPESIVLYVAIITDGKGVIPNGTKIPVPNHKLKWDKGNPTGHGIIFMGLRGQVYCYVVPGGV